MNGNVDHLQELLEPQDTAHISEQLKAADPPHPLEGQPVKTVRAHCPTFRGDCRSYISSGRRAAERETWQAPSDPILGSQPYQVSFRGFHQIARKPLRGNRLHDGQRLLFSPDTRQQLCSRLMGLVAGFQGCAAPEHPACDRLDSAQELLKTEDLSDLFSSGNPQMHIWRGACPCTRKKRQARADHKPACRPLAVGQPDGETAQSGHRLPPETAQARPPTSQCS